MGFFSWKTQDTDRSIANNYSNRKPFTVVMMDNKGNKWFEQNYEGYGVFGGKDYYELLAEMNGVEIDKDIENYEDKLRAAGISLAFSKGNHSGVGTEGVYYPNLVENASNWVYEMAGPESCPDQGYFYDETDYEDNYEDEDDDFQTWNEAPYGNDEE